jgi:DNA-binding response OmpR family regulator
MNLSPRLLIAEDNACIALSMVQLLQSWNYQIQGVFSTGEKAWQEIQANPPNLVMVNIHLAGKMDGIEFIQRLRVRFGIPVIIISGVILSDLPPMPGVWMLPKPFLPFQLKRVVEGALDLY